MQNVFWADQLAAQAIERARREGRIVTCRSGASPSGAKHIGNMFDVLKSYFVYKAVLRQGYKARMVLTSDDRDPLRKIPDRLAGLDGKLHELDKTEKEKFEHYIGFPYFDVPDPFGCCSSWAEHFDRVWTNGIAALGITDIEIYNNNSLYIDGKFRPYIKIALEKLEKSVEVMKRFQKNIKNDFIPFSPICENCGRITTTPISFDLKNWTIKYVCGEKTLSGKYKVNGCGKKGETSLDNGKLTWRFEWPAQWAMFATTFEPFGKEHAEGSWRSGQAIAKEIYNIEPPIPHVYEFLLIDGKKMAGSLGNVYITQQMLEIIEPEVFRFFYTKKSKKQRDLDIKHINRLVNDFDFAERVYFGVEKVDERERVNLTRMYELSMTKIPEHLPVRIPYRLCSLIVNVYQNNLYDREFIIDKAIELMKSSELVKGDVGDEDRKRICRRITLTKRWLDKYAQEEKITVNEKPPKLALAEKEIKALEMLKKVLGKVKTETELYNEFYNICESTGLDAKRFFTLVYKILINREQGPRLAPFIFAIGKDKVRKLLEEA